MAIALGLSCIPARASTAATFTVNSAGDGGDVSLKDGICADQTGHCTLRAAIQQANANRSADTIAFDLPVKHFVPPIAPGSPLPAIASGMTIDGATQPMTHAVVVDGVNAGPVAAGLSITSGTVVVRGMVIIRFGLDGIDVSGGTVTIAGNTVGRSGQGNAGEGVLLSNVSGDVVGGTAPSDANVIGGNGLDGVAISGGSGNKVVGNRIGTSAGGTAAVPNAQDGVLIAGSSSNIVGGAIAGSANVISGNTKSGIEILGSAATGNAIEGNLIGTTAPGGSALPNCTGDAGTCAGVLVDDVPGNTIGGAAAGAGNTISGNKNTGVEITGISASGNVVAGNHIGTDPTGAFAILNPDGVAVVGAPANTIGGTASGAGNVISGNGVGVAILGIGADGNEVLGNLIGTTGNGTAALGNSTGVLIQDASNQTIGGTAPGSGNIVSGNTDVGIELQQMSSPTSGNVVQGNRIGTNASGDGAVPNGVPEASGEGVEILAPSNIVGGTDPAAGNLISGNGRYGIVVQDSGNQVLGNRIGTDAGGSVAISDYFGVFVVGSGNTIGLPGHGNLVSGNAFVGVQIDGPDSTGNTIAANLVGTTANGSAALANGEGIVLSAPGNTIGGTVAGAGNVVSGTSPRAWTSTETAWRGPSIRTSSRGTSSVRRRTAPHRSVTGSTA